MRRTVTADDTETIEICEVRVLYNFGCVSRSFSFVNLQHDLRRFKDGPNGIKDGDSLLQAATRGAKGRLILSPTPPVLCLSTLRPGK